MFELNKNYFKEREKIKKLIDANKCRMNYFEINIKFFKNKYKKKVIRRFYGTTNILLGKEKILIFLNIVGKPIKKDGWLKNGIKNKIKGNVLNHEMIRIEQKFIDESGSTKNGFISLTSNKEYKIINKLGKKETIEAIKLDKKQFLSKEIILFKDQDIKKDKLNFNIDSIKNKKYLIDAQKKFKKFFIQNNEVLLVNKNGLKEQKVYEMEIDKINKEGSLLLNEVSELQDKVEKINKIENLNKINIKD